MADGEFRIAGAFVEVNLKDNTEADEKKIRARLEKAAPVKFNTALKSPDNIKAVKEAITASSPAKIRTELDEPSLAKAAAQANSKLSGLQWAGAFAGLPAAAAAGAAGTAGALAGVPILFAAIGAAAVKSNAQVTAAFSSLKAQVVGDTQQMAGVLAGPLASAAGDLGTSFTRLRPQIQTAMAGSVPAVHTLTGAVTDFAEGAMPGMVAAVQASDAPLKGLRSLAGQTGSGLSLMLTNMASGSQAAGQSLGTLGGVIHDAEGWAGSLMAVLANGSTGTLPQFRATLGQLEGAVLSIASHGMPALQGASSGFLNVASGVLGVVQLLSGALGSWTGPLAQAGGALFATNSMAKLFGTSLGEVGFGLRALMPVTDAAGNKTTAFGTAVSGAKGFTDKAAKGFTALAEGGLNPLGIAMGGVTIGLALLGQAHQDAAAKAAAQTTRETDLAGALRQSNGVIDANVRALAAKALQDFNAGDGTRNLLNDTRNLLGTGALPTLTDAYLGNGQAVQDLVGKLRTLQIQHTDTTTSEAGVNNQMDKTAIAANDLANIIESSKGTFQGAAQQNKDYATATEAAGQASNTATAASSELAASMAKIRDAAATATDKGNALVMVMDRLSGRAPTYEEATQALNDGLRTLGDSFDTASATSGTFDKSMMNVDGTVNTITKNGSALQDKMMGLEKSMADASGAVGDMVKAGTPLPVALEKINDQASTSHDRFIEQARSMGFSKVQAEKLAGAYNINNSALGKYISTMSDADLKAAGITKTVDNFGNTILHLPDGKDIKIGADTTGALANVQAFKNQTDATTAETTVGADIDPATKRVLDWRNTTFNTIGNTTTYTNTDPATGQVRYWKVVTDQTGAQTTTYATTNPATGAVTEWKRNTDGTWAQVQVGANTTPARNSLQGFIDSFIGKVINIPVHSSTPPGGILPLGGNATGNLLKPYAAGGIAAFASGGMPTLTPMQPLASMVPANTWRVVGDNMRVPEAYIPVDPRSKRSQDLLTETNSLMGRGTQSAGSKTVNNYITVNAADVSNPQIAHTVGGEIAWRLRSL